MDSYFKMEDEVIDKRRRRRTSTETDSESCIDEQENKTPDEKKTSDDQEAPAETVLDSSGEVTEDTENDNSEYESAEEDQDEVTGTEEDSEEETETVDDDHTYDETDDDVDSRLDESICSELVEEERQSGDGQEQPEESKEALDDDMDAKNPAYIPRRGAFYEHDNRLGEEEKKGAEAEVRPKKPLWKDEGKWMHDLFKGDLQAPKSDAELIALYGYDIRSLEKPPDEPPKFMRRGRGRGGRGYRQQLRDFLPPETRSDLLERQDARALHEELRDDQTPTREINRDYYPVRGGPRGGARGGARGGRSQSSRGRAAGARSAQRPAEHFQVKEEEFPGLPGSSFSSRGASEPRSEPRSADAVSRGKQWTNSNYRSTQSVNESQAAPPNSSSEMMKAPAPAAPSIERRSNRSSRGRGSEERHLPERLAAITLSEKAAPTLRLDKGLDSSTAMVPNQVTPGGSIGVGDVPSMLGRSQKPDQQSRPKRYSTQRQRPLPEQQQQQQQQYHTPEQVPTFYPPGFPATPMYSAVPSSRDVTYSTAMYNGQTAPYPIPSGTGMSGPPRLFPQPNVTMATISSNSGPPPGMVAAGPYAGQGVAVPAGVVGYGPGGPASYSMVGPMSAGQMSAVQLPAPMPLPVPIQVSVASAQHNQSQEMYSHYGTTYYSPTQGIPTSTAPNQSRQHAIRDKRAIPIIHPQDVKSAVDISRTDSTLPAEMMHRDDDRERTPTNE